MYRFVALSCCNLIISLLNSSKRRHSISSTHHDNSYDEIYTTIAYHFISCPGITTTGGVVPPRPRRLTCPAPFAKSVRVLESASNSTFGLVFDQRTHRRRAPAHQRYPQPVTRGHCLAHRDPDHLERLRDAGWRDVVGGERLPHVVGSEEIAVGLVAEDGDGEAPRGAVAGDVHADLGERAGLRGGPGLVELEGGQVAGRCP